MRWHSLRRLPTARCVCRTPGALPSAPAMPDAEGLTSCDRPAGMLHQVPGTVEPDRGRRLPSCALTSAGRSHGTAVRFSPDGF